MRTETIEIFKFEELSDSAKETAINNHRENNLNYEWWEFVYEDATQCGEIMGIDIDQINFSGFACQGDGARFSGDYAYKKGAAKLIREHAPTDDKLHAIADGLQELQKPAFYMVSAKVSYYGATYEHENMTSFDVADNSQAYGAASVEQEEKLAELLRDFMRWIYSALEREHDYLQDNPQIIESIKSNDCEFYATGKPV